jgi:hypothetical protein
MQAVPYALVMASIVCLRKYLEHYGSPRPQPVTFQGGVHQLKTLFESQARAECSSSLLYDNPSSIDKPEEKEDRQGSQADNQDQQERPVKNSRLRRREREFLFEESD